MKNIILGMIIGLFVAGAGFAVWNIAGGDSKKDFVNMHAPTFNELSGSLGKKQIKKDFISDTVGKQDINVKMIKVENKMIVDTGLVSKKKRFSVFSWHNDESILESDGDRVYFNDEPIENIRKAGKFEMVGSVLNRMFKGIDAVWYVNMEAWNRSSFPDAPKKMQAARVDADVATFNPIEGSPFEAPVYFRDKDSFFVGPCKVLQIDVNTVRVTDWMNGIVRDKNGAYHIERTERPNIQNGKIFCDIIVKPVNIKDGITKEALFDMGIEYPNNLDASYFDGANNTREVRFIKAGTPAGVDYGVVFIIKNQSWDPVATLYENNNTIISDDQFQSRGFVWRKVVTLSDFYGGQMRVLYVRNKLAGMNLIVIEADGLSSEAISEIDDIVRTTSVIEG